jgi:hypothetical protein
MKSFGAETQERMDQAHYLGGIFSASELGRMNFNICIGESKLLLVEVRVFKFLRLCYSLCN